MTVTDLHSGHGRAGGFVPSAPLLTALIRRAVTRMIRLPAVLAPTVIMPAFFITAFTGSFDGISRVEGYPTDNIVNWVAAFAILQSCAFAGIGAASAMATDLDTRFIDRLLVSPMRRGLVLLAPLVRPPSGPDPDDDHPAHLRAQGRVDAGRHPRGGDGLPRRHVDGGRHGPLGLGVVLLIGNIRAMALVQVISFLVLFPSTGQVPIELMDGWLATMARWNPATPVLAMTRQGFLGEISWSETWPGLLVIGGGLALFGAFARTQLRRLDG